MKEVTHILDFITSFVDTYVDDAYNALPGLLKCIQVKKIPDLPPDLSSWTPWIEQSYITKEPSMLSLGTMSKDIAPMKETVGIIRVLVAQIILVLSLLASAIDQNFNFFANLVIVQRTIGCTNQISAI